MVRKRGKGHKRKVGIRKENRISEGRRESKERRGTETTSKKGKKEGK